LGARIVFERMFKLRLTDGGRNAINGRVASEPVQIGYIPRADLENRAVSSITRRPSKSPRPDPLTRRCCPSNWMTARGQSSSSSSRACRNGSKSGCRAPRLRETCEADAQVRRTRKARSTGGRVRRVRARPRVYIYKKSGWRKIDDVFKTRDESPKDQKKFDPKREKPRLTSHLST